LKTPATLPTARPPAPEPNDHQDHRHQDHGHHPHDHHHGHDHGHDTGPPLPHRDGALLSARHVSFKRDGRAVLENIDLDIGPSEIVTLIGPNGAGKTTLVRILLGLNDASSGAIVRGDDLVVGYVPQRFDLDRTIPMTVERFLSLGRKRDRTAQAAALAEVGAPDLAERQFTELSGGELQRVLIARALLRNPTLLVLDEPVRGIDYSGEAELYGLISRIRSERGVGILLVSHDLHIVMAASDRVICINRHVCCSGVPETVAQHPEYARLFGPQAARNYALYRHAHDHKHDLAGRPYPSNISASSPAALTAAGDGTPARIKS
jgi:zinc transport system ATP-binding protein